MNTLRITKVIAAEHRANESSRNALNRSKVFFMMKQVKRMPRKHMTGGVLEQIFGSGGKQQHIEL